MLPRETLGGERGVGLRRRSRSDIREHLRQVRAAFRACRAAVEMVLFAPGRALSRQTSMSRSSER